MVFCAAGEWRTCTRGLTACADDAHETHTVLDGSSPQVRWICSGVPSAGAAWAARVKGPRGDAAAARPVAPALFTNPRREIDAAVDSASSGCSAGCAGRRFFGKAISPVQVDRSI